MRPLNAGRAVSVVGPAIYGLALAFVGMAFVTPSRSEERLATAGYRAAPGQSGASCKLSIGKQVKAVKAFAEMLPVFRHPRCTNCHGGLDPTSEKHPGADQLDPNIDRMADLDGYKKQCQDCHDGLKEWNTPGQPLFFAGKSDEDLCRQMKQFEHTGEAFVEHIENDHHGIQFIATGFNGDRALGEGLADYHLAVEKPPGTQAELTAKAQTWVDDLEGHYGDSPECGCVVPKIRLKIHHTMEHNIKNAIPSREASEVNFEVKLLPMGEERPGGYQGQVSLVREVKETVPRYCTAGGLIKEQWTFSVMFPPGSDSLTVWRMLLWDAPPEVINCGRSGTVTDTFRESALGMGEPFTMSADSGATKELKEESGADKESLSITVVEVPAGE